MLSRLILRGLTAALLLFSLLGFAADEVAVPPLQQRVTDLTQTLSTEQQVALEAKLAQFEQQKGSQIAILLVPTTQPEAIEQYSIRVVEAWKLGRKGVDDGVLILVAKDDRKMRIEVGYGLEGIVPDTIASQIIREGMQSRFKQGDFYGGLDAAVGMLMARISGEPLPEPERQASSGDWGDMLPVLLFGGLLVGGLLRAIFGSFLGGVVNGGLVGAAVWLLGGGLLIAAVIAFIAFLLTMSGGLGGLNGYSGGYGGGGFGGNGGFSGGGGDFGGGGASGDW